MSMDGTAGRGPRSVLRGLRDRGLLPDPLQAKIASLLGIAVALSAAPASANPPPRRIGRSPLPPWSRTIGHPPPRPLAPTGGAHPLQPQDDVPPVAPPAPQGTSPTAGSEVEVTDGEVPEGTPARSAGPPPPVSRQRSQGAHVPRPAPSERLFPRAIGDPSRERAMRAHPAGSNVTHAAPAPDAGRVAPRSKKQSSPSGSSPGNGGILVEAVAAAGAVRGAAAGDRYTVRPGDSLWDIAEMKLGTKEARRIARYWPRIHRANRDVIGGDPNLIVPGQVLTLPPERP